MIIKFLSKFIIILIFFIPGSFIFAQTLEDSIQTEPKSLFSQLNENGKLIAIIRPANIKIGKAKLFFKISNEIGLENLFDAQVSKLSIFKSKTKFSF